MRSAETVLGIIRERGRRRQKHAILDDRPKEVFSGRSEVVERLLAQECELCGAEGDCQVHHVRKLADLDRPGRGEKPPWDKRMAARRRKTLVVCQECHQVIHQERPKRHGSKA
jgi:hypothetical protein